MFADEEFVEWPPNPAVGNKEAMRRAIQVFHIMTKWADVYMPFVDGEITAEQVVEKFNNELAPIGMAYKLEMQMDPYFLVGLVRGFEDLQDALAEAEKNEENKD